MRSRRISKRVLASPESIVVTLGTESYGIVMVMWLLGPISDDGSYPVIPRFSLTSVIVDFFQRNICLVFRCLSPISSACPCDLAANFARGKKNSEGASSDKCEAEKFMSESKDYEEAEGFIPQQVFNCDLKNKMPEKTYITQAGKGTATT
ncbi:hypothetical protein AVEN_42265-1 [Araneus ventricosus]|uniref:Uncharacterized protein n=1 Tax=Araneus ventricosus TaxID=182803 RepID=A0A4Y2AWL0_ARAVE|nr:hypothetical protein AVEN_42265-1 [Araneus ventricosus]